MWKEIITLFKGDNTYIKDGKVLSYSQGILESLENLGESLSLR